MKKTIASLASASLVVALGLSLVGVVGAQTYGASTNLNTTNSSITGSTTDTSGLGSTTNPGLPNTGAGGDAAMNFAILLGTGLLAVGGTALIARKMAV